jgi:hypothetical protein
MVTRLELDDGRTILGANLGMHAMLELIAAEAVSAHARLARWLEDVAGRPWIEFDLRAFSAPDREAFWDAARRALDAANVRFGTEFDEGSIGHLRRLLAMKRSIDAGEPPQDLSDLSQVPPLPTHTVDLDDLWGFGAAR